MERALATDHLSKTVRKFCKGAGDEVPVPTVKTRISGSASAW